MNQTLTVFERLLAIMDELREKCPWDKKQTMATLRNLTIEETYELADAIDLGEPEAIREELGDLLLHIVFYAKIASEEKWFDLASVIREECEKLIKRHPHIYGHVQATTEEQVKQNWEKLKLAEGKKSVLSGVPVSLPALIKAYRIQEKAAQVGFQWTEAREVWDKVREELQELQQAVASSENMPDSKVEEEFGDVLFALVNYARYIKVDPEAALEKANRKFIRRFEYIENTVNQLRGDLRTMTLEQMDALWEQAKSKE
ncbi:MAG: nucleoside triphosphate pyrophosphohydrolase [Chitinophagales bacterium]|nr:MAG: nucleoside triphosphate pyrophosphohydrolase [Chitinophagales bacterium]